MAISTLTRKGQTTIPLKVRNHLKLRAGDKIEFVIQPDGKVVVVANLAPREFGKGLVSHGMLLATGESDALTLATVDGEVKAGARLK